MKNISKQHNSCVRVLEFFKLFFNGDIDIKDINKVSNSSFKDIEAHETFLKYIATFPLIVLHSLPPAPNHF